MIVAAVINVSEGPGAVALAAAAVVLGALGFWVVYLARRSALRDQRLRVGEVRAGAPTALACGLSLLVGAYHAAAYALPDAWSPIAVPAERAWIVGLAIAAAVAGSLVSESLERRGEGESG